MLLTAIIIAVTIALFGPIGLFILCIIVAAAQVWHRVKFGVWCE